MDFFNSTYWRSRITFLSKGHRPFGVLAVFCCFVYLPGIFLMPVLDQAEARNLSQIQRAIIADNDESGFSGQNFLSLPKRSVIRYLQKCSARMFPDTTFVAGYRLPSFFAALLAIYSVFYIGRLLLTAEKALVASLLSASCILGVFSFIAGTSYVWIAALALSIIAVFVKIVHYNHRSIDESLPHWLGWLLAGVLIIGIYLAGWLVVVPLLGGMVAIVVKDHCLRDFRGIWRPLGSALLLLVLIYAVKCKNIIGVIDELTLNSQDILLPFDNWWQSGRGFNLLALVTGFWPGMFFLLPALMLALRKRMRQQMFLLGAAVAYLLVLLILPYASILLLMPLVVLLSLLCSDFIMSPVRVSFNHYATAVSWVFAFFALLIPVIGAALLGYAQFMFSGALDFWFYLLAILTISFTLMEAWFLRNGARLRLVLSAVLFSALFGSIVSAALLPGIDKLWPGQRLAASINTNVIPSSQLQIGVVGYDLPSIAFYTLAREVNIPDISLAAEEMVYNPQLIIVLRAESSREFLVKMRKWGVGVMEAAQTSFYNFTTHTVDTVLIYRRTQSR